MAELRNTSRALLRLDAAGWAWEWMRRSSWYRDASRDAPHIRRRVRRQHPKVVVIEVDLADRHPQEILFWENPQLFYGDASVFWHPQTDPSILPVTALASEPDHPQAFNVLALTTTTTVFKHPRGIEYVLFGDGFRTIQLEITHGSVLNGAVQLLHAMRGLETVHLSRLTTVRRLAALQEYRRLPTNLFPALPEAEKWARWLRAYDLAQEGHSHPEIARQIYNEELVDEALASGASKWPLSRVERLLGNAHKMVDGAYQQIFNQKSRLTRNS